MASYTTDILIIHKHGERMLEDCLSSIYAHTSQKKNPFSVRVLFNAHTDNSPELLRKKYPEVVQLFSQRGVGFAEACNHLAQSSQADSFVFLNDDVEVSPRWLESLQKPVKEDGLIVATQPKVLSLRNRKYFEYAGAGGGFIDRYGYPFCRGRMFQTIEEDRGQYDSSQRLFWGCGVCLLVDAQFFREMGGFDESLFFYAEELDFCWRTNTVGKEIWFVPDSVIYHLGSATAGTTNLSAQDLWKDYLITRNHLLVFLKNSTSFELFTRLPVRLLLEFIAAIRYSPVRGISFLRSLFSIPLFHLRSMRRVQRRHKNYPSHLVYSPSIVATYFLKRRKTFQELKWI